MSELEPNVGIVGTHVEGSLSPVMHNAAYKEMNVDLSYGRFALPEIDDESERRFQFREFLQETAMSGVKGLSITMPFKHDAMEDPRVLVDQRGVASKIGALNTLSHPDSAGTWGGDNTDWLGAVLSLEEAGVDLEGSSALILGAGGTAKAVAYGLAQRGASHITVANRTQERALRLAIGLKEDFQDLRVTTTSLDEVDEGVLNQSDILYNTTNVGQDGTEGEGKCPLKVHYAPENIVVNDAVYMPLETPLLKAARDAGVKTIDGTRMLLHQAAAQVRIFTGQEDVPIVAMDDALQAEIQRRHA